MKNISKFVPTEYLPNLLCAQCKRVLSQFPIYCYSGGSTCGRCPYPENGIRNEAYEVLAQKLTFPCSYNENGCLENLLPKDVPQHERTCSFRKYNCPIIPTKDTTQCEWKGLSRDLLDHFEQKHRMFILSEHSFEVDFVNGHNENYLFPYGEGLYVVNRSADSKKHLFFCTVSYIGHDPSAEQHSYKIILESGNKSSCHEISNKINVTTQVVRDVLNNVLNNPLSIIARIEVFKEEEDFFENCEQEEEQPNNINYDLLQELECLVCMEYMVPPIHQCVTGHSICYECKKSLKECPTCRKEFKNTQNFALAQVIQHIEYPCKHSKCKFTAKAKDIKQHEVTCVYSPYPCPLKDYFDCDEEIQFDEIYSHISSMHYENLLEMDTVVIPFCADEDGHLENLLDDCFIIKYGFKLFKLHFQYLNEKFMFAGQLIGPAHESSQYNFAIDILDSVGNNHRAYMTNSCGGLTECRLAFEEPNPIIMFTLKQIGRLISEQLCFRVKISKN